MTETLSHLANYEDNHEQPSEEQLMQDREEFISENEAWCGRVALESLMTTTNYSNIRKDSSLEFTD